MSLSHATAGNHFFIMKYSLKKAVKNKTNVTNLYLSDGVHPRFSSPWRVAHTQTGCSVYLSTMSVLAEGVIWSFVLSYPPRTGV